MTRQEIAERERNERERGAARGVLMEHRREAASNFVR
jgi:hypothetical protein